MFALKYDDVFMVFRGQGQVLNCYLDVFDFVFIDDEFAVEMGLQGL